MHANIKNVEDTRYENIYSFYCIFLGYLGINMHIWSLFVYKKFEFLEKN